MPIAEALPLYQNPTTTARVIDTLPAGAVAALLEQKANWSWVCYRGIKGWISTESLPLLSGEPLPEGILAEKRTDTVLSDIEANAEKSTFLQLSELRPWFVRDSILYAGFYEGLPGEPFGLLIVNFAPKLALILRSTELDPEAMEVRESESILTGDYRLAGNLLLPAEGSIALPFQRAEFIVYQGRRGLLIEQAPGTYRLLWRREVFS